MGDVVRESMLRESKDMWKRCEEQFKTDFSKQMDMFQNKDNEVIRMKDDKDKFEVSLDTSQYQPDELRVNVTSGVISVEGKHEEKAEDGRTMVSRQFSRKYSLPAGAKQENVVSNLSSDGVLVISAPKSLAVVNGDRNIPIKEKKSISIGTLS